jgi:hypothetical protein
MERLGRIEKTGDNTNIPSQEDYALLALGFFRHIFNTICEFTNFGN